MDFFQNYDKEVKNIKNFLQKEFAGIRTGAASVSVLDGIKVEAYGTQTPLNQLASISIQDAVSLVINPFDPSISDSIEKAIVDSGMGLGVSNSGSSIIVSFPSLTAERRVVLIKLAKEKLENARVSLRKARDDIKNKIESVTKNGEISEDEKFRYFEEMEKIIKESNEILDKMYSIKEKEINE